MAKQLYNLKLNIYWWLYKEARGFNGGNNNAVIERRITGRFKNTLTNNLFY